MTAGSLSWKRFVAQMNINLGGVMDGDSSDEELV